MPFCTNIAAVYIYQITNDLKNVKDIPIGSASFNVNGCMGIDIF